MDLPTITAGLVILAVVLAALNFFLGAAIEAKKRPCPYCRKNVSREATVCPYCQSDLAASK